LPLPEKWHGLQDVEERYRKRYLDLLMDDNVKAKFVKRAQIIQAMRDYLLKQEFLEVTTPTLQPLYGGASARPFKTHLNALDTDVFLRIAPELYLKRLLVGGFEKVFEFTTNFRNEGIDREHNPEFSAVEFYAAYKDYNWAMDLVEDMLVTVAPDRFKKPFRRVKFAELMRPHDSLEDAVFKEKVRPTLIEPTFVTDYPKDMLPLTKLKPGMADTVEAFQFYVGGLELVKAFTELNDPIDQRERFAAQENLRAKGDEEAQRMDEDFIEALEYGMPPAAGVGIGIDRLVTFLTDSHSLREIILFPMMRPK
ncbi:MAG: Lysine-tRNA ligase, partial [Parcubacteria group bacterium GW2011_GWA1_49_11]